MKPVVDVLEKWFEEQGKAPDIRDLERFVAKAMKQASLLERKLKPQTSAKKET
jgi:hypothetical protein